MMLAHHAERSQGLIARRCMPHGWERSAMDRAELGRTRGRGQRQRAPLFSCGRRASQGPRGTSGGREVFLGGRSAQYNSCSRESSMTFTLHVRTKKCYGMECVTTHGNNNPAGLVFTPFFTPYVHTTINFHSVNTWLTVVDTCFNTCLSNC